MTDAEEVTLEHAALLIALGTLRDDRSIEVEAFRRVAALGRTAVTAVVLRALEITADTVPAETIPSDALPPDWEAPESFTRADAAAVMQTQLDELVARHGELLTVDPVADDLDAMDEPLRRLLDRLDGEDA